MKIKATAASTDIDNKHAWSYSESAILELAETAHNIPLIYRRKNVGVTESGKCINGCLIIYADVEKEDELFGLQLYLAPGGLTDFVTNGDIIERCFAHHYFLTEEPSDRTLTPFEIVD